MGGAWKQMKQFLVVVDMQRGQATSSDMRIYLTKSGGGFDTYISAAYSSTARERIAQITLLVHARPVK